MSLMKASKTSFPICTLGSVCDVMAITHNYDPNHQCNTGASGSSPRDWWIRGWSSSKLRVRHPEARGRCSQGERMLYGRDQWCSGGTGKAEAAKWVVCIPRRDRGRRNWPEAVPRKMCGRKRMRAKPNAYRVRFKSEARLTLLAAEP